MPSWRRSKKWSHEKPHLDNARKLRGVYFIDPEDKEFKETIKNARKKLDTSIAPALPCKIMKKNCGNGASNKVKSKLACILEADESKRLRMGESLPNHHEDHIAGKGDNSLQHYNLVHKFIPMPQAMKIPAAKAQQWTRNGKIGENFGVELDKSQKQERGDRWTSGAKVHFASLMDTCHLKNAELEAKHQKYKGRVVLRGDIVKKRLRCLCSIHWTRIISITSGGSKGHGYHLQIARLRRTSSGRSICLYPSKNGRCSQIIENSQFGMSRHLDSSTTTQMAKIMVQYGRPSRSSWAKSVRSSSGRTIMGKALWENPIKTWLGENSNWECLFVHREKRVSLICVCGWHKKRLERNKILIRCGKYSIKKLIWENQHLSSIMYIWDVLKDNVK